MMKLTIQMDAAGAIERTLPLASAAVQGNLITVDEALDLIAEAIVNSFKPASSAGTDMPQYRK